MSSNKLICEINGLSIIEAAISQTKTEITALDETIESVKSLKPNCDAIDCSLAVASGALCGLLDVFLVGKPMDSPLGDVFDKWFENKTCDFAKICGWKGSPNNPVKYLENRFNVPYDQRGCGDSGSIFDLTPKNHHFRSLGHNPTLMGLFFSILDQFTNSSHFVSDGQLIKLIEANDKFELRGNCVLGKLWAGFANFIGHLVSDATGSSVSKTRGTGIPSPLWSWANSIIVIRRKLGIPVNQFDRDINELACELFNKGFDTRFQIAQAIPVFINELVVRFFYLIRRLVQYYINTTKENRSIKSFWAECEPFSNPTINRLLIVAHGTFCLVDVADASIRSLASGGGGFNPGEFFLRINLAGIGRFTISLYGETKRVINLHQVENQALQASREKKILKNYIEGLDLLKERYNDQEYLSFIDDLKNNECIIAFEKSVSLAILRDVPPLRTKSDIDSYFTSRTK